MHIKAKFMVLLFCTGFGNLSNAEDYEFGFSKVDITPTIPVRLSGYGNRNQPFEGIDEDLYVRVMAIQPVESKRLHVLVSVDTIGFPGTLTKQIHAAVQQKHQISRSRFVVCCTHSHTAPHIAAGLSNLFASPLTQADQKNSEAYTEMVKEKLINAVDLAIADLRPGKLLFGTGNVTFARNRRVLQNGVWTGFGENPNGPVDHTLPVLKVTDQDGQKVRGLVFNYACHCTTFGGDYNRVNGDWAGYASQYLEEENSGAVALCTIGCGADANPERPRNNPKEVAQLQGREISDEISELNSEESFLPLNSKLSTNFGYAGLPIDRPSDAELQENLKSPRQQVRNHAEIMIDTKRRMGRLPESYPMPIQTWRFGNDFVMVFLGGEVCVDYALRLKRELPQLTKGLTADKVWVSAYSNDVFAYVAPERMRKEGGYEVDFSMIYYLQPGRWSSGTEEVIIRRVNELFESKNLDEPSTVSEALKSFTLPDGFKIDVIAAEPLVRDPINFAVDEKGRLWVVEMGDYPRGNPRSDLSQIDRHEPWDGPPAGRIKILTDIDKDGIFDEAKIFLDQLSFPTGVFPWKDGVLISGAPDLIYARDVTGDGICDETEILYTGFEEANPQHRIAGFEYGLDGWLYLSAGTNNKAVTCVKTGEKVNISGRDCRIHPETGRLEAVSGRCQYGRCRDDFGNWFGNSNSQPLFQYVIEDQALSRNPYVASPSPRHYLTEPATAPPVYPTSRTLDRFNDLHALDRFTSACSPNVFRDLTLGKSVRDSILICEPVHNLISRIIVDRSQIEFKGSRHPSEVNSEFISSSDNWHRPVRTMTAPDGSLWICDMYRHVIEHPEWIPEAWQAKLDLYAGFDKGRIYRVYRSDSPPTALEDFSKLDVEQLVERLKSSNGWKRDTAQRLLLEQNAEVHPQISRLLRQLISESEESRSLIQAAYTLSLLETDSSPIRKLYRSDDPEIVLNAIKIWGVGSDSKYKWQPYHLLASKSERIHYQIALAAGNAAKNDARIILTGLLKAAETNEWIRTALLSSSTNVAEQLLIKAVSDGQGQDKLVNALLETLLGNEAISGFSQLLKTLPDIQTSHQQRVMLLTALEFLEQQNLDYTKLKTDLNDESIQMLHNLIHQGQSDYDDGKMNTQELATYLRLAGFEPNLFAKESLSGYLHAANPAEIVSACIATMIRTNSAEKLLALMKEQTPAVQAEIQTAIMSDSNSINQLLKSLESNTISLNDLSVATRDLLLNSSNNEIKNRISQLKTHDKVSTRAEIIESYREALSLPGNAKVGKKLFEKSCSTCHRHNNVGKEIGAQLASLKAKPAEFFLNSILDPNAAAEAKYRGYAIATSNGKVYSGLIADETATSIKLIQSDGKSVEILKTNVEEISSTGRSFMPEGLEKTLTPQDIADIIAFLKS